MRCHPSPIDGREAFRDHLSTEQDSDSIHKHEKVAVAKLEVDLEWRCRVFKCKTTVWGDSGRWTERQHLPITK